MPRRYRGALGARSLTRGNKRYKNGEVYSFKRKRSTTIDVVYDGTHTESHGAFKFMLSDLTNYTEFTTLFDKYRIRGIRAQFLPRTNILSQANLTGTLTEVPPIVTVVDYDDAVGTDDYLSLMQFENAKIHSEFKPFSVFFRPQLATGAYAGGVFTGFSSDKGTKWIDAASTTVEYYGLKWATLNYAVGNSTTIHPFWDVVFTYYIQLKYPR